MLAGLDALHHVAGGGLRSDESAAQIDREHTVEILELQVKEIAADGDAGIVDENVEPAEVRDSLFHRAPGVFRLRQVRLDEVRANRRRGGLALFRVEIGDRNLCAVGDITLRDCAANALRAAGDERDPVVKPACHVPFLLAAATLRIGPARSRRLVEQGCQPGQYFIHELVRNCFQLFPDRDLRSRARG